MTPHDAIHKLSEALTDLHHAELDANHFDNSETKNRVLAFIRNARNTITHVVDDGLGQELVNKNHSDYMM